MPPGPSSLPEVDVPAAGPPARHPDAILDAERRPAFDDPDALRAIAMLTARWAGADNEWINGLAVAAPGEVVLSGSTDSPDSPLANARQPARAGPIPTRP
jgi:hypothetical protein